ncbi:MAG: histidine kinase [Agarilytica sp.]
MAVVWMKVDGDMRYEVRTAGSSLRLYTNGIFHSHWNPNHPVGGQLWDLLFLPSLFVNDFPKIDRCLVLGVGGGAVINALFHFAKVGAVQAVDLDENHLYIAKKYFLKNKARVELTQADAIQYVKHYKGEAFDYIVEDLFAGAENNASDARRAVVVDKAWLKALSTVLTDDGVLVFNFENERQARAVLKPSLLKEVGLNSRRFFRHPGYENCIGVCLKTKSRDDIFYRNLDVIETLFGRSALAKLQYSLLVK